MELSVFEGFLCLLAPFVTFGFNIDVKQASVLSGTPDSYYGYSVAMMVERNRKSWVFVGAPRGNDTGLAAVDRPGAIYKCDFQQSAADRCEQLHIDNNNGLEGVEFNNKKRWFKPGKKQQWLGGAIDVPPIDSGKGIVTCSHRWYNKNIGEEYYMNGFCYEIPAELTLSNTLKYPAMVDGYNQTEKVPWNKTVDYFSMAALGMAVHRSEKESKLLLGTPGLFDWTGGFVEISGGTARMIRSETSLLNDTISSLYGSAITSGEYFGDNNVYYVLGGPRANLIGKVVLFNSANQIFSLAMTDVEIYNESLPVNAYFGSVLCTADVNMDGLDDLLVGAPLFSPGVTNEAKDTADQGRVFLYLGSKRISGKDLHFSDKVQIFSGRQVPGAQFGLAISGLGDMNGDTYEDIAIGAPYEDGGQGAVYIYNGYRDGLYPMFSQRIEARQIDPGLRGFGISLSKPADLNWDGESDLAVGAYLSDQAVVLYGQPVINMNKKDLLVLNGRSQQLTLVARNSSDIFVYTCFNFLDSDCRSIDFDVVLNLDIDKGEYRRVESYYTKQTSIHLSMNVFKAEYMCNDKEIGRLAVRSTNDLVSPIVLEARYSIRDMACPGMTVKPTINAFNGSSPGDPLLLMKTVLYFKKDCPDNKCETDLHVSYQTKYYNDRDYFTSGMPFLGILIKITKDGHPSYGSNFIITFPKFLSFRKYEQIKGDSLVSCFPVLSKPDDDMKAGGRDLKEEGLVVQLHANESGQICSFGNPMYNDSGVEFLITMEVPREVTISSMEFHLAALTQSIELNPADNNQTVVVPLRHEVTARFTGRASPEIIFVGRSWNNYYPTKHIYELENSGPSLLPAAIFDVHFPQYQQGGHAQLFMDKIEVNCSYPCGLNCSFVNLGNAPSVQVYENGRPVIGMGINSSKIHSYDAVNRMDCTDSGCALYHCGVSNLRARKSAVISIQFALSNEIQRRTEVETIDWPHSINKEVLFTLQPNCIKLQDGDTVTFTSKAHVRLDRNVIITNLTDLTEMLRTSLVPPKPTKGVEWWIIVVSIIGGIVLIALIVFILYKVGFFKRKKWEEMKKEESQEEEKKAIESDKVSYTDSEDGILEKEQPSADNEVSF